jgi:hypothetical protein
MSNNPQNSGERAHQIGVLAGWREARAGIQHLEEAASAYEEASGGYQWEELLSLLAKIRDEVGTTARFCG